MRPDDLAVQLVRAALDQVPALDPAEIDDLMLGCGLPGGEQGYNMARVVAILLGLDTVPGTPNGSVITPDGVLIVNETFGNRCTAFDLTQDGRLVNRRTWAEFAPLPSDRALEKVLAETKVGGDGACLDAEGALWIADAIGGRLLRVRAGGEIADEIHPVSPVYACALGGADGCTLYACAAPDFDEAARSAAQEATLIAFRVQVPAA